MLKTIMNTLKILFLILLIISFTYFIYLHLFLSNDIKKNWDKYKCNPYVIPLASLYEKNVEYTYRKCTKTLMVKIIDTLYYPIHILITIISKILNIKNINLNDIMNQSKSILLNMNSQIFDKKEDIIERLKNKDNVVVDGLCFSPQTHIKLKNGRITQMKNIKLGDELKNGSIVYGTMSLYNLKKDGSYISNMYCIPNGADDETDIIVSESHLLKEKNEFVYVKNHKDSILLPNNMEKLCCLITDDHNITIGDYVFSDWEDNGNIPELLDNNEYIENVTLEYCN